jgi:2-methylisocitrate lyase-like PEP mutase family enzyme
MAVLRQLAEDAGREVASLRVLVRIAQRTGELGSGAVQRRAEAYWDAGADDVVVDFAWSREQDVLEALDALAGRRG